MVNTKGQQVAGKQTHPGAIKIQSIEIFNYRVGNLSREQAIKQGLIKDITRIVVKVLIVESLQSPTLVLKLGIKDATAFAETFPIVGQEIIRITTLEDNIHTNEEVEKELLFYVTEYPKYGKGGSETTAGYTIQAISKHAYLSGFKKISRPFSDTATAEMFKILVDDLEFDDITMTNFQSQDISKSKGVINLQTPLSACEFFRQNAYTSDGSPFFFFQTLNGRMNCIALKDLVNQPAKRTFFELRGYTTSPETPSEFTEQRNRILSIFSNLGLSSYKSGRSGVFASETNSLDWSNKSYTTHVYKTEINPNTDNVEKKAILSESFKVFDTSLNKLPEASCNYVSKNDTSFTEDINYGSAKSKQLHKIKAYQELLNTYTHQITVVGDTNINAGRIVEINLPSAIDPKFRQGRGMSDEVNFDPMLSGRYLVSQVIHEIQDGKYISRVNLVRDSLTLALDG